MSDSGVLRAIEEMERALQGPQPDAPWMSLWQARFEAEKVTAEHGPAWAAIADRGRALAQILDQRVAGLRADQVVLKRQMDAQRRGVRLAGAHFNGVYVAGTQQAQHLLLVAGAPFGKGGPFAGVPCVDLHRLARFGVRQYQAAQRRQFHFKTVHDLDGDHVVAPVGLAQRPHRAWPPRRGKQNASGGWKPVRFHSVRHRALPAPSKFTNQPQRLLLQGDSDEEALSL